MKRAEAFALVRGRGGTPRQGVTRQTNLLVVGELGWPLVDDGRVSNSLARARTYAIAIASERQFLEWVGRSAPDEQNKAYTAAQLAGLSKIPESILEQLALFGLIEAKEGCYGFRDLAAARQVAGLLASGVALSAITRSLHEIRKWLPGAQLSNLRLFPESSDRLLIEQMKGRTDETGQFVLPVATSGDDASALFDSALAAEEDGDAETAERLYRRALCIEAADADALFNLGNLLRAAGRVVEAEAAYRDAVKADMRFAQAWYNLADLYDEQGRACEAIDALRSAIKAEPDYADAVFNLALLLQRLERHAEASSLWKRYIALDASSPWSGRARRALKFCEMKLAGVS